MSRFKQVKKFDKQIVVINIKVAAFGHLVIVQVNTSNGHEYHYTALTSDNPSQPIDIDHLQAKVSVMPDGITLKFLGDYDKFYPDGMVLEEIVPKKS